MIRRFAVLVVVACVGLGVPAVAASATGYQLPDLMCGPITTSVRLRHDLTCAGGVQVADAPGGAPALPASLTIDLGGHTLTTTPAADCGGPFGPPCASIYVSAEHTTVNIRNGRVSDGINYADGNVNVTANHPALGGVVSGVHVGGEVVLGGLSGTLRTSSVGSDVMVGGFGSANVSNNTIARGMLVEGTAVIDRNIISGGVGATDLCASICGPELTVTHNLIVNSPSDGVSFDLSIGPNQGRHIATISGNVIAKSAGAGISLSSDITGAYVVTNNLLAANGGDGLTLVEAPGRPIVPNEVVVGNIAVANGGHGFNIQGAPAAFTINADGNIAFANHTQPQCVGIVCWP